MSTASPTPKQAASIGGLLAPYALVTLAALSGWTYLLLQHDTPAGAILKYLTYYLLCLTVPGAMVLKAAIGSRGSWIADLVWGTIVGLCLELVAWAGMTALGVQSFLFLWPLLPLLLLLAPGLRERILDWPLPPRFGVGHTLTVTAIISLELRLWWSTLLTQPLPPTNRPYYGDLLWHLGLAHEATRSFPLLVPQMVDAGLLRYSWFVHAHLASSSLITGLDLPLILFRLWYAPVIALTVAAVALLARQLSGKSWAGGLAAMLVASAGSHPYWRAFTGGDNYLMFVSPTQVYSVPISILCAMLVVTAIQGSLGAAGWGLLGLVGVAASGSKSSTMLMLAAAVFGTVVVSFFLKQFSRRLVALAAIFAALLLFAMTAVTGGAGGTGWQLFSSLTQFPPFQALGGDKAITDHFATDLIRMQGLGFWLLLALLAALAVRATLALLVVAIPFTPQLRQSLSAWFIGGIVMAGWLPFLLMAHPGYSQVYFYYSAVPFAAVLVGWLAACLLPKTRTGQLIALGSGIIVAVISLLATVQGAPSVTYNKETLQGFIVQVALFAAVSLSLGVIGRILRRRTQGAMNMAWLAVLIAPLLITPLIQVPWNGPATPAPPAAEVSRITLGETEAAMWVSEHVPDDALMATNAACNGDYSDRCDARRWWLSGLGGRRVYLDGWRYVPEGADGALDEFDTLTINNAAFEHPTDESIDALRQRGVSWTVVEHLDGYPSPDLSPWGTLSFQNGLVSIYHLN